MTWIDLVNDEINTLVDDKEKLKRRLDKIRDDDSGKNFDEKVSLMADIKAIDMSVYRLHVLLGRQGEITE